MTEGELVRDVWKGDGPHVWRRAGNSFIYSTGLAYPLFQVVVYERCSVTGQTRARGANKWGTNTPVPLYWVHQES